MKIDVNFAVCCAHELGVLQNIFSPGIPMLYHGMGFDLFDLPF